MQLIPQGIWLAASFPSSKGARYPYAVELAKGADYYREDTVGGGLIHVAGFRNDAESIRRAIAFLEYAQYGRGCMVSNGTSIWSPQRTLRVLRCYLDALSLTNTAAHCKTPYESRWRVYFMGAIPALLPCKLIDGYFLRNWHRTGTVTEQLQAAAVEAGCEWCPLWTPTLEEITPPSHKSIE